MLLFKQQIYKHLNYFPNSVINTVGLILLPIEVAHLETYLSLPQFDNHKDPFDRLIIATSCTEKFAIISIDEKFKLYQDIIGIVW